MLYTERTLDRIDLIGRHPLASGGQRDVYELPGVPAWLVKVLKPTHVGKNPSRLRSAATRLRPGLRYRFLFREYRSYLELKLQEGAMGHPPPVSALGGMVMTDLGTGVLSEAVRGRDGALAPTFAQLWRQDPGNPDLLEHLNTFTAELYAWNMHVADLSSRNLVLATGDRPRLVLVDGLGDPNVIPMRTVSAGWNRAALTRRLTRFAAKNGLRFDPRTHSFSVPANR